MFMPIKVIVFFCGFHNILMDKIAFPAQLLQGSGQVIREKLLAACSGPARVCTQV